MSTKVILIKAVEVVTFIFAAFGHFLLNIAPPEVDIRFPVRIGSFLLLCVLLYISTISKNQSRRKHIKRWLLAARVFLLTSLIAAPLYLWNFDKHTFHFPFENSEEIYLGGVEYTDEAKEFIAKEHPNSPDAIVAHFGGLQKKLDVWNEDSIRTAKILLSINYLAVLLSCAATIFCLMEGMMYSQSPQIRDRQLRVNFPEDSDFKQEALMEDFNFDVFLSHNKADQAAIEMLAHRLEKSGLKVWLDKWNLLPGDPWQDEIEEALDRSRTVAVFVGPSGIGGWHNEEMRSALETRVRNHNRRVIPVLLPGAVEPELPRFLRRLHWVDFRNGLEDEATFNLFIAGITGKRQVKSDLRTTISNNQQISERKSDFATDAPRIRTYRDFDLRLAHTGDDKLEVEIISPHSGDGRGIAPMPAYTTASIESGEDASLQQIGEEIGQALFPEEVRRRFETSLHDATKAGEGLRVRLRFHGKGLANIPWEAARLDEDYLALRPATPLVRYVPASEPPRKLSIRGPVHVLGIISSPLDQLLLAVDEEKARLEEALAPLIKSGRLRLTWLKEAATPALQEAFRRNVHVVHYIGHGDYDAENQEGELLLEDEASASSPVKASWLATLLRDSDVRLAFLNACKTGHAAGGVAEVLVRREVPAAVGMQVSVRDDVATAFSKTFYAALVDGWPVDAAVVEGRKAIVNALNNDPNQPDWVHPVLYMRAPDGVLFG